MTSTKTVPNVTTLSITQPWNASNANTSTSPSVVGSRSLDLNGQNIAWLVLAIFTLLTNCSFLFLISCIKNLRKPSNSFIASMAVLGILWSAMYIFPRWALSSIINNSENWFYCSLTALLGIFFTIVINLHLCLISLDKYIAIIFPFFYLKHATNYAITISIGVVWVLPLSIAIIPPLTFRNFSSGACVLVNSDNLAAEESYFIAVFSILFFVPIICMVFAYSHIFLIANKQLKVLADQDNSQHRFLNIKAAKYLSIIVGVFLIAWLPYVIFFFAIYVGAVRPNLEIIDALFVLRFLAFSYPCINPVMYGLLQSDLRKYINKQMFFRNNRIEMLSTSQFGFSNGRPK
ncbi:D(1)-like dopamine receptor [Trichoplax sp. H2]|nr:D(1)-like dopamine receptor [Trichoplax sp. H2]|eukprot:RDD46305.1 D(1)-like dopamine receptor [Trichoplax sp. H2]